MASRMGDFYVIEYSGKKLKETHFGFKSKKDALAFIVRKGMTKADINREREVFDKEFQEWESDDKWIGYVNKVKRKSGYAYVYQNADFVLGEDYKWNVTPQGTLTDKR